MERIKKEPEDRGMSRLLVALLSTFIVIGFAQVTMSIKQQEMIKQNTVLIQKINSEYTPIFVIDALIESNNLMNKEIIGRIDGDQSKVLEAQQKYIDLQRMIINQISRSRGSKSSDVSYAGSGYDGSLANN